MPGGFMILPLSTSFVPSVLKFMPWTRRQVRKLLSSGSPLDEEQKDKMKAELHANPAMGHAKKGSKALKKHK